MRRDLLRGFMGLAASCALIACESSDPKGNTPPSADVGVDADDAAPQPDASPSDCPNGRRTVCADVDGDGHGAPATVTETCTPAEGSVEVCDDCDDTRPEAYAGATEVCNGADDNCDGAADEGLDVGAACTSGVGACGVTGAVACRPDGTAACDAAPGAPSAESCDGIDNDCNGRVDDTGATETCDGADNDCDGTVDEGFGVGDACSVGQGACRAEGVVACAEGGQAACAATAGAPAAEVCDGIDNDCDGTVDNAASVCDCVDGTQVACGSDVGACALGTQTCVGGRLGACEGGTSPAAETCDGVDQDCDGAVDNREGAACECLDGDTRACGSDVGACTSGTQTCVGGAFEACNDIGPSAESCNGLDDDCNGVDDDRAGEVCECIDGQTTPCGSDVGACEAGLRTCISGRYGACVGAVEPVAELYDGADNDCNGATDDVVCGPAPTDFPLNARYAACPSIDGTFHAFDPNNISTIARTQAYDQIADLLWRRAGAPTPQSFTDARVLYSLAEGIESRVNRRFDSHFVNTAPAGINCRGATDPANYPQFCVGPATIGPLVRGAFDAGSAGMDAVVNAAKIEAGLMWFFWTSVYKEANSCRTAIADCDSSYAYYNAAAPRAQPAGLARYVNGVSPAAHDRVFDGTLAVHCWRELDNAATAADLDFQNLALAQLDPALDYAAAALLIARLYTWASAAGDARAAAWAFVQVWAQAFDRALRVRDIAVADRVATLLAGDGAGVDPAALEVEILSTIPCP